MNQLKQYYWYGKSTLRIIVLHIFIFVIAVGAILGLLDFLGGR